MSTTTQTETCGPENFVAATPQKEHNWLQKFVGTWRTELDAPGDQAGDKSAGEWIETVCSFNGLWIVGEGTGEMPGCGPSTTMITIGYDPAKGKFVGSWIGSMMTHIWNYSGDLDESTNTLSLFAEGPRMDDPTKTSMYADKYQFESNDHRILTSHMQGEDGQWTQFMTAHYYRKS